jgi:hypothetical protein
MGGQIIQSLSGLTPNSSGTQNIGTTSLRWNTLYATNGTINTSDVREKNIVGPLKYGLNEVLKLKPVSFVWKPELKREKDVHLGLIAQEVANVIPEIVDTSYEPSYGMKYGELIPVCIQAIKELYINTSPIFGDTVYKTRFESNTVNAVSISATTFTGNVIASNVIADNFITTGNALAGNFITSGNVSGANMYPIASSGTIGSPTLRWNTIYALNSTINTSDIREKNILGTLKYGLDEVLKLKPVSFVWKPELGYDRGDIHLGLIAQDVANVIPEVVDTSCETHYGMKYGELIPVCIQATKDLYSNITSAQIIDIPHPTVKGARLVHSSIMGPRCDFMYRNTVKLMHGAVLVNLDTACSLTQGTFEATCKNPQFFLQNTTDFDRVIGTIVGNTLKIVSENSQSKSVISWMVVAERDDSFVKSGWKYTSSDEESETYGSLVPEYQPN